MPKRTTAGAIKRLATMTTCEQTAYFRARSDAELAGIGDMGLIIASVSQDEERSRDPGRNG
jgi:hypothetical protein